MSTGSKKGYIIGSLLFIIGIILWIFLWQMGAIVLSASIFMVLSGILSVLIQSYLNKSIPGKPGTAEPQNQKRQIVIRINDNGTAEIVAEGIPFNDVIAILEVSKYQMINQFTRGGSNPVQIIKRQ